MQPLQVIDHMLGVQALIFVSMAHYLGCQFLAVTVSLCGERSLGVAPSIQRILDCFSATDHERTALSVSRSEKTDESPFGGFGLRHQQYNKLGDRCESRSASRASANFSWSLGHDGLDSPPRRLVRGCGGQVDVQIAQTLDRIAGCPLRRRTPRRRGRDALRLAPCGQYLLDQ
jgi:hypothetical protein